MKALPEGASPGGIYPRIEPVPAGLERPLWSVMIPTYNVREDYLRATLQSVLAQDPGPDQMQIEVVDDCSNVNDPAPIVREAAASRVIITRNVTNLGAIANFNRCIEQSRGHLIHILHNDDYIGPGFYQAISDLAARYPECALFASRIFFIDETGIITSISRRLDWMELPTRDVSRMLEGNLFQCPGVVVRRSFYEQFGGFLPELPYTADWEMWVRAVHFGSGVALAQPLASYRTSAGNESGRLARSGENIRDHLRLAAHLRRYDGFSITALRRLAANLAFEQYRRFAAEGDLAAAQVNLALYRQLTPLPRQALWWTLDHLFADRLRQGLAWRLRHWGAALTPRG